MLAIVVIFMFTFIDFEIAVELAHERRERNGKS